MDTCQNQGCAVPNQEEFGATQISIFFHNHQLQLMIIFVFLIVKCGFKQEVHREKMS